MLFVKLMVLFSLSIIVSSRRKKKKSQFACNKPGCSAFCKAQQCHLEVRSDDSRATCVGNNCKANCKGSRCYAFANGDKVNTSCIGLRCNATSDGVHSKARANFTYSKCHCLGHRCVSYCIGNLCRATCGNIICKTTDEHSCPRCQALCMGTECNAKCYGDKCDARCIGKECYAICQGKNCTTQCKGKQCDTRHQLKPNKYKYVKYCAISNAPWNSTKCQNFTRVVKNRVVQCMYQPVKPWKQPWKGRDMICKVLPSTSTKKPTTKSRRKRRKPRFRADIVEPDDDDAIADVSKEGDADEKNNTEEKGDIEESKYNLSENGIESEDDIMKGADWSASKENVQNIREHFLQDIINGENNDYIDGIRLRAENSYIVEEGSSGIVDD